MSRVTDMNGLYMLHAYVRPAEVVYMTPFSRTSFARIYQNRPDGARYAVAGYYNVAHHGDEYRVFDLFEVKLQGGGLGRVITPEPRLTHRDPDAAVMAAVMLYGQSCNNT